MGLERAGGDEPGECVVEGQEAAADARRARAAVGLQHVAVDDDLTFAEHGQVAGRPQASGR